MSHSCASWKEPYCPRPMPDPTVCRSVGMAWIWYQTVGPTHALDQCFNRMSHPADRHIHLEYRTNESSGTTQWSPNTGKIDNRPHLYYIKYQCAGSTELFLLFLHSPAPGVMCTLSPREALGFWWP